MQLCGCVQGSSWPAGAACAAVLCLHTVLTLAVEVSECMGGERAELGLASLLCCTCCMAGTCSTFLCAPTLLAAAPVEGCFEQGPER